jgi:NAD-dependent dihydropyrimidine dehydrogenase PreA subunit
MVKDELWHGIPRKDIPWFPVVGAETCIGCTLCYTSCGRGVYEMQDNKAVPVNAMSCMVGCCTCGTVCPTQAIEFPDRDLIWKLERELTTRVRFEVAGEFGEKRFLVQLEETVKEKPYDFVNMRLEVPTVKGAMEKTPAFMSFDVTSTVQDDIQGFFLDVRDLIRRNGLTLVSENKL